MLEYEGLPKYYKFCRKLGHNLINCRALKRKKLVESNDKEIKKGNKDHVDDTTKEHEGNEEGGDDNTKIKEGRTKRRLLRKKTM